MLETAHRRSAGCPVAFSRLALAFDGSAASLNRLADVRQLFSPASGVHTWSRHHEREVKLQEELSLLRKCTG